MKPLLVRYHNCGYDKIFLLSSEYSMLTWVWARVIVYIVQFAHFDASQSGSPETPTSSTA